MASLTLQIAQTAEATWAEGPGCRYAVWFQGCPLRCPGCCNPEMLAFEGGNSVAVDELLGRIETAANELGVEGVTLLGGEPFAHAGGAAVLARDVQARGLSVMIFSGYELGQLRAMTEPAIRELLRHTDLLVDGPYLRERPETTRRWIGSANQRIHFLTDRYDPADSVWRSPNTLEIRLQGGEVSVNGFPARSAVGLWKRPRRVRAAP